MPNLKWIAQPLTAFALGMLALLNLLLLLFWYSPALASLNKATDQQGASLVRSLAFDATAALNSGNRAALSNILNHFTETGLIISATVTSVDDSIRLNALAKNAPDQGRSFRQPIDFSADILGYAELVIDETPIQQWRQQTISSWLFFNLTSLIGLSFEWLSRDDQSVARYHLDPFCGRVPNSKSLLSLFSLEAALWQQPLPRNLKPGLPVYLLSGAADPVHAKQANLTRLIDWLQGIRMSHDLQISEVYLDKYNSKI